jgi:hypothetical protein
MEKTGEMVVWLDAPLQQCALPHVSLHPPVLEG